MDAISTLTESYGFIRLRTRTVTRHFADWTVDGAPLRTVIENATGAQDASLQEATCLSEQQPQAAVQQLDRLLGLAPPDFGDGRVALLPCPVCYDLGCWAISAELVRTTETVQWRHLGWQDTLRDGYELIEPVLTMTFVRRQYDTTLTGLRDHYRARIEPSSQG